MQTTYTYAVIAASGATVFVSGDESRARLMLASCRADYPESVFALVLETCYPSGRCDAHYIVSFYQPLES
jgi:hypothetical protein